MPPEESSTTMGLKRQAEDTEEDAVKLEPAPAPKRQRVSRACDQCRAAREKCDGIQPLCFPCASQNRQCSWEEPKRKRGVQTGYIRTLELALGWIFDKIPGSEEALHSLVTHEGGQGRSLLVGKDTSAGSRLHRRWRRSTVHKEIDRVLSGGDAKTDKTSPAADESDSGDEGERSYHAGILHSMPSAAVLDNVLAREQNPTPSSGTSTKHLPGYSEAPGRDNHDTLAHDAGPDRQTHRFKLPPNYWRLLDIYFSYTHCWFPVHEKALVQKTAWLYPEEGLSITRDNPESASHAELWATLALAAYQDEASQGNEDQNTASDGYLSPEEMYRTARSLIPREDGNFEARHVNALLLLALINLARQNLESCWILVGFATRISLRLGLHSASIPDGNRRSQHTYMGCFILDTIISTRLDRPPHLRAGDMRTILFSGEDDQDEWASWVPCHGFGIQQQQSMPSRSPAHSISSFHSLYAIHKVQSQNFITERAGLASRDEPYTLQVQRAFSEHGARRPFSGFITGSGGPPAQLPSMFLLRVAYQCAGAQSQSFPDPVPKTVLQSLEEYIVNFGVCGIPPLFSTYMALVSQRYNIESLTQDERNRWTKVEEAINVVWVPQVPKNTTRTYSPQQTRHSISSRSSNLKFSTAVTIDTTPQQLPTPTSYYADAPGDQRHGFLGDVYPASDPGSSLINYTNVNPSHSRPILGSMNSVSHSSSRAAFDPNDMPGMPLPPYSAHARPSFGSATFDYDAILDDIATIDQTDRMESDPQFMANLGFAPGSNLAEVLTHEFMGFS